jgi:hypothetical protein
MLPTLKTPLESAMMLLGCGSSGGGAFSPLSLSPMIWLDGSQLGLSDGASVSSFTDLSGNGNHFVQGTGANQPVFRSSGINGIGAVESDGVDDFMTLAAFGAHTSWWAYLVCRGVSIPAAPKTWWSPDNYGPDGIYFLMETKSATAMGINSIPANPWSPTDVPIAASTNYAFHLKGNASGGTLRHDRSATISATSTDASLASAPMRMFARGDGLYANIRVGELIFGRGTLTGTQETAVWTYLSTKWGTLIP